jgi:hypothetical protein
MASTRKSPAQVWSDDLLLALRMREVPGARIGEVLAEVQSHVAETGEDPRAAFGEPRAYADEVADALGTPRRGLGALLRSVEVGDLTIALACGLASFLLADGLWSLGAGEDGVLGLPAWLVTVAAVLVLGGAAARTVAAARRGRADDAVIDPRTGADMVPFPRWAVALLIAVPVLALVAMFVGGMLVGR